MTYMGKPYYPAWLDNLADDVAAGRCCVVGATRRARRAVVTSDGGGAVVAFRGVDEFAIYARMRETGTMNGP
jgi:hypothetical protein